MVVRKYVQVVGSCTFAHPTSADPFSVCNILEEKARNSIVMGLVTTNVMSYLHTWKRT